MGIISAALYEANPEMTVFASVSDSVYGSMPFENTKDYPASCFLNALASEIKEKGDFKWSLCIDGISDPLNDYDGEFFAAARPEILSSCLKSIFSDGTVKADRIMYVWKPGSLSEPLADSYVYSVLKMFLNQDVSLFAVDLRECGDDEKDSILSIWDSHGLADISFSDPVADLIEGLPEDASRLFESIKAEAQGKVRDRHLRAFQDKISSLRFLDPACGSGNFLTETYLSLRRLENKVIAELTRGQSLLGFEEINPIKVNINQFYGIEINDFAVTVAATALWIAEAQMMAETEKKSIRFTPVSTEHTDGVISWHDKNYERYPYMYNIANEAARMFYVRQGL